VSEYTLIVECNTDALAAAELGESAIAAGGSGDFSDEQMDNLRGSPGLLYILPDDDTLGGEAPRRWVFDLYPKALLFPAEYGEGLEDVSQLLHKRGKATARKVLEGLKARAVDALELELREVEENSADGSQSLATYRRTKERILPLVARLEDEGERDAALRDVARRTGLGLRSLRKALDDSEEAPESEGDVAQEEPPEPSVAPEEIEELVGYPGVLDRYATDAARIHGVVRETEHLKLLTLNARGAQLEPLPNGRPAGASLVLTAEAGRGKNYLADAVAGLLPPDFCIAFESASAKSLYYKTESNPAILKHRWVYPNEAEATDELVEIFRPLISGGRASHLTVNKDSDGRNTAQELQAEGPVTVTIPTVRNKLDTQLQSRMLVSELPDYDGRVAAHSRAFSRLLLPDQAGEDHTPKVRTWQAALRRLTAMRRVVFALEHQGFCFDSDTVSHGARLWGNLLGLMLAHAWLEQRNREVIALSSGELAVAATPEDYESAYNIFKATCERSVVNLSDTHRKVLDAVYDLKQESDSTEGFSHRKIAERAGVHHSTIGEHRTYLVKSVKLLRETESGMLDLVADAEPSWWNDDDLLEGFPHPEQVWRWWEEKESHSTQESARHTRHPQDESHNALSHAENPGGHSTRHPSATTRHPEDADLLAGMELTVADETPASESPVDKPDSDDSGSVVGVAGASENGREKDSRTGSWRSDPMRFYPQGGTA
jgi:AcrR family transcriptional regulator